MKHLRKIACLGLIATAAGCGSYDFTVNDRVVYSPKPLFTDYALADAALGACVEQAIADQEVRDAADLLTVNCSHAGITDLGGLGQFTGLRQLKLSANAITDISELAQLTSLTALLLDGNEVTDPVPLYELGALEVLDLTGNDGLQCPRAGALVMVRDLSLPEHCGA